MLPLSDSICSLILVCLHAEDAEVCVTRFTSLVRSREISSQLSPDTVDCYMLQIFMFYKVDHAFVAVPVPSYFEQQTFEKFTPVTDNLFELTGLTQINRKCEDCLTKTNSYSICYVS